MEGKPQACLRAVLIRVPCAGASLESSSVGGQSKSTRQEGSATRVLLQLLEKDCRSGRRERVLVWERQVVGLGLTGG